MRITIDTGSMSQGALAQRDNGQKYGCSVCCTRVCAFVWAWFCCKKNTANWHVMRPGTPSLMDPSASGSSRMITESERTFSDPTANIDGVAMKKFDETPLVDLSGKPLTGTSRIEGRDFDKGAV